MPDALDGPELTYRWAGRSDPGAPTLVLLHGLGDSGDCWPDAVRRWAPQYRVVGLDLLGHGRSPRFTAAQLETPDPIEEMYAATLTAVTRLAQLSGNTPVTLVAHSMGAGIATALAARRPDLVRAAVLEEPAWRDPALRVQSDLVVKERIADCRHFADDPPAALAEGRRENPTWPESELEPWGLAKTQVDEAFLELGVASFDSPWEGFVTSIQVPTLVLVGSRSSLLGDSVRDRAERLANPEVTLRVLDAGHCIRRDVPDEYHRVVDPWLAAQNPLS
ncbi:MAG TPA: alpha/beta fold hydrolase [Pedococcus sp.]|nr:alpha/beta fold hydrolase [Pedococcus sp.]